MSREKSGRLSRNLITKRVEFSASHKYWNDNWSEQKNKEIFGKHSEEHGHNFLLEVTVEGSLDEDTGMIINLFDLKQIIKEVVKHYDHMNLNRDIGKFSGVIPTTENIASALWEDLNNEIHKKNVECKLYNIRLYETPDLYVDYRRV